MKAAFTVLLLPALLFTFSPVRADETGTGVRADPNPGANPNSSIESDAARAGAFDGPITDPNSSVESDAALNGVFNGPRDGVEGIVGADQGGFQRGEPVGRQPAWSGQGSLNLNILKGYKTNIEFVINVIFVPLLFAIAFLVFVWGVFQYFIWGAEDPKARETGRQFALYGVLGFVVILSVWGLVYLTMNTLGLWGGSASSYRLSPPTL